MELRTKALLCALAIAFVSGSDALAARRQVATQPAGPKIAIMQNHNVFLVNLNGGDRTTVTTRGTSPTAQNTIAYQYSWSPDGKYLLLAKTQSNQPITLLLLDSGGKVLRTLASYHAAGADFPPSWADDAQQIIYIAADTASSTGIYTHTVDRVDLNGHVSTLFKYTGQEGCGGGSPDPAQRTYWDEAGSLGIHTTMQWSTVQQLAIYTMSCRGGLNLTDLRTGKTRTLGVTNEQWNDATLTKSGELAATIVQTTVAIPVHHIVLVNTHTGAVIRTGVEGELPVWSADGHYLYFQQRKLGTLLHLVLGTTQTHSGELQTYKTSIWRMSPGGTQLTRIGGEDAFGFGPVNLTPDGKIIIFSRVDNDWNLWRHRLSGDKITDAMLAQYSPKVKIQRFDLNGKPRTIVANAGQPAIQP